MTAEDKVLASMTDWVLNDPDGCLEGGVRIYSSPLVAFAAAGDPLFWEMKKEGVVGPLFRTPDEWLPGAVSVISYFLPFSGEVRRSNYACGLASTEWLHARMKGEEFSKKLRRMLIREIEAAGSRAMAPLLSKDFTIDFDSLRSNWSERHVAFIAGLGTFGLNRGLITGKGMAGRFGSVVTDANYSATEREYSTPFQYCPTLRGGSCGICIGRCPKKAISEGGKKKSICYQYLFVEDPLKKIMSDYGYPPNHSTCGKCQVMVPCEDKIP